MFNNIFKPVPSQFSREKKNAKVLFVGNLGIVIIQWVKHVIDYRFRKVTQNDTHASFRYGKVVGTPFPPLCWPWGKTDQTIPFERF